MPDNYTHKYNAQKALEIAGYTPRNYEAFIWGANGPDILYSFKMYEAHRKDYMYNLAIKAGTPDDFAKTHFTLRIIEDSK